MPNPLNVSQHLAVDADKGRTAPPSGGNDSSREERSALESLGAELLRRAAESQPALEAAWDELMARWGVHGQPVGIQRLREMMEVEGQGNPDGKSLSRELIATREESRP